MFVRHHIFLKLLCFHSFKGHYKYKSVKPQYCIGWLWVLKSHLIIPTCPECSVAPILPLWATGHSEGAQTSDYVSGNALSVTYSAGADGKIYCEILVEPTTQIHPSLSPRQSPASHSNPLCCVSLCTVRQRDAWWERVFANICKHICSSETQYVSSERTVVLVGSFLHRLTLLNEAVWMFLQKLIKDIIMLHKRDSNTSFKGAQVQAARQEEHLMMSFRRRGGVEWKILLTVHDGKCRIQCFWSLVCKLRIPWPPLLWSSSLSPLIRLLV